MVTLGVIAVGLVVVVVSYIPHLFVVSFSDYGFFPWFIFLGCAIFFKKKLFVPLIHSYICAVVLYTLHNVVHKHTHTHKH